MKFRAHRHTRALLSGVMALAFPTAFVSRSGAREIQLEIERSAPGEVSVGWQGTLGRTFVLSSSGRLDGETWLPTAAPITGAGSPLHRSFEIAAARRFFRLTFTDEDIHAVDDFDMDGIPTAWEIAHGYDPLDPVTAVQDIDGDGRSTLAEYLGGTLPGTADAQARSFNYDANGRLVRVIHPGGRSISYVYDDAWNILSQSAGATEL